MTHAGLAQLELDSEILPAVALPGAMGELDSSMRWESDVLDLESYLQRISYRGARVPTLETLKALIVAHLDNIPFENLDILTGMGIRTDLASVQEKLVYKRRGGYCHEHNTLFATVLDRMGFAVSGRSARIMLGADDSMINAIGHTMLSVMLDGRQWLVDVGIGNFSPRGPVPLENGSVVRYGDWEFRIDKSIYGRWVLRQKLVDGWYSVYQFSDEPYYRADYASHNFVVSHNPESVFTTQIIVRGNGESQSHVLVNRELKTLSSGMAPESRMISAEQLPDVLTEKFGLELPVSSMRLLICFLRTFKN